MAQLMRLSRVASLLSVVAADLVLETCSDGSSSQTFSLTAGKATTVQQNGKCVDVGSDGFIFLTQCSGANSQLWSFQPDGTVQNGADSSSCWNAWGGSTSPGTQVGMYSCGSAAQLAANDVFWPLESGHIFANESGLCITEVAAPGCVGDECCSLNGLYDAVSDSCSCFRPWSGQNCSALQILPSPPIQGYGMAPNLTSWGGNIVYYGGKYHLYVAEMANGCSLNTWGQNSQCVHATADHPTGPFLRQSIAVGIWCHNPQIMMQSNGTGTSFYLFHIGDGSGGNPKNCSTESDMPMLDRHSQQLHSAPAATAFTGKVNVKAGGSTLHAASSPDGPFLPTVPLPNCNNPSPMLHPNGTWFLLCDSTTLHSAPSALGPWTQLGQVNARGGVAGTYEDAFLFLDPRGHWHVIFHVYTTDVPDTCVNSTVSGHYFSRDGFTWLASPYEPFTNFVQFTNGSSMVVATRERPKLLFNSNGDPTHLVNGVTGGTSFCAPTPCVNCKYNYWDFTLVSPLAI